MRPSAPASYTLARIARLAERDPRRAVALARRAHQALAASEDTVSACATYMFGWCLLRWERTDEAYSHLQQAQALFLAQGSIDMALRAQRAALLALPLDSGDKRLGQLDSLIAACERRGLADEALSARIDQAILLNQLGRALEALACATALAAEPHLAIDAYAHARLLRIAAIAKRSLGALAEAQAQLDEALSVFLRLRTAKEIAHCWLERAAIFLRREQFAPALADLDKARIVFRRLDLPLSLAFCDKDSGIAAAMLGRHDQALTATLRARTTFGALGIDNHVAHCDLTLGAISYYVGLFDLATAAFRRAEAIYTQLGLRYSVRAQRNQAMVLRAQAQPQAALALLDQITQAAQAFGDQLEQGEIAQERARALRQLGRGDEALAALAATRDIFAAVGNDAAVGEILLEQGWLALDRGDPQLAERLLQEAATLLADRPAHRWRIEYGLGRCAQQRGDIATAQQRYQASCATVSALRQVLASEHASSGIFQQAQHLYADALGLAVEHEDAEAALLLIEQQRALALLRQLLSPTRMKSAATNGVAYQERSRIRDLLQHATSPEMLAVVLTEYSELLLQSHQSALPPLMLASATLDLDALRAQLSAAFPAGWAALVYAQQEDSLLAISISAHDLSLTIIPLDAELRRLLARATQPEYRQLTYLDLPYRRGQACRPWGELARLAERLLPGTLRASLTPTTRLLLAPIGSLHALPWAALRLDDGWLCERAIIQLLPTLTVWPLLAQRTQPGRQALLIGVSEFGSRGRALPHVAAEIDLVAARWAGAITRLEDAAATRTGLLTMAAAAQLRPYGLIHIASHAQLMPMRGLLAHIKLHDDELWLDEVARLGLDGALVVLAACDGGASDVLPGEEVLSLSWALLAAGARDVITSLWPVYDRGVQVLLKPLYDALMAGADPPTALARAQRLLAAAAHDSATMELSASPLVWGGMHALGAGAGLSL